MSLLITIPVLDEESRLESGVKKLYDFLAENNIYANIEIADNGSTDRTKEISAALSREFENVRSLHLQEKGVGRALKASWEQASEDFVGYMDVDLSTDLSALPGALDPLEQDEVDVVNGSRLVEGAHVQGRSLLREVTSRSFNWLLKRSLKTDITDGMCGFKFLKRSVYQAAKVQGLRRNDWFFNTELLIRAEWLGYRIREIPVTWVDDPHSNVNIPKLTQSYYRAIMELKREKRERQSQI